MISRKELLQGLFWRTKPRLFPVQEEAQQSTSTGQKSTVFLIQYKKSNSLKVATGQKIIYFATGLYFADHGGHKLQCKIKLAKHTDCNEY